MPHGGVFEVEICTPSRGAIALVQVHKSARLEGPAWRLIVADELVGPEGRAEIIDGLKKIARLQQELIDQIQVYVVNARTSPIEVAPAPPAASPALSTEPHVWDISPEALAEYDAAALVSLRTDHRAIPHESDGCAVCETLVRRLGEA